jgi:Na+-driven multidrug efflux pump
MSTPTNETPRSLERLVDRLGISPDLEHSDGRHWRLVVFGAVIFALNALPEAGWDSSPADQYSRLLALSLGPILVSQGASGLLLRRGKETLSLGFSVLQALLTVPMAAFGFLLLYEWVGLPWAVGLAAAVCAVFYAVCWKRSSRYDARRSPCCVPR